MSRSNLRRLLMPALLAAAIAAIPVSSAFADGDHGGSTMPGGTTPPGGTMPHMGTHEAPSKMRVRMYVRKDAKMGYNLHVTTKRFRWAPWNASKRHIDGQGHAHLFVDGKKVTRLYGPWYYLGQLDKGTHTIKVTLNGNDHGDYMVGERMIADQKTITVR